MGKRKKSRHAVAKYIDDTMALKDARDFFIQDFKMPYDPNYLIAEAREHILNGAKNPEAYRKIKDANTTLGFDNDYILADTTSPKYRSFSIELRRQLIKDFSCTNHAEKILVDTVVSAYIRVLQCNRLLTLHLERDVFNANINTYLAVVSKELDRANRHLLSAHQALVQLKQPALNIQIKSKNTFLAQNQQFNTQPEIA